MPDLARGTTELKAKKPLTAPLWLKTFSPYALQHSQTAAIVDCFPLASWRGVVISR